jgi:farnesyl-diphosphate farnesyltransferase
MTPKKAIPKVDLRLLKSVSRSFYLSIRLMPASIRPAIGIAYLLARASDTIADTESAPTTARLRRLGDFEKLIKGSASPHGMASIQRDILPEHPGEKRLIETLPDVLKSYQALGGWEWKEIADLMSNIIRGQSMDLETFTDPSTLSALADGSTLEDYIYLVAGCVGEWWTRLCFHNLPNGRYSRMPEEDLTHLGSNFGKGLQLVNILRDMPKDLDAGRCYLPGNELKSIGTEVMLLREAPTEAQPVFELWEQRARELLDQGRLYIMAVRSRRTRMACYLPWRLGLDTLNLFASQPPLLTGGKVKVSRSNVRRALLESVRVAFSNKLLENPRG